MAFTVWYGGEVKTATARQVLSDIQRNARASGELRAMSATAYARALVDDAPFFLPRSLLAHFERQTFGSAFDRALEYLAAMPTSGVRILARFGEADRRKYVNHEAEDHA